MPEPLDLDPIRARIENEQFARCNGDLDAPWCHTVLKDWDALIAEVERLRECIEHARPYIEAGSDAMGKEWLRVRDEHAAKGHLLPDLDPS